MSKLVQINSKDRVSPDTTTAADFRVNLGFDNRISSVRAISVKEVQFVNSFYNVNANTNKYYFTKAGTEDFIEVSPGQYTLDELTAALIPLFAAKGVTVEISLGATAKRLVFSAAPAISFRKYKLDLTRNPMARILGITNADPGEVTAYVAGALPDLAGVKSVYICSPQLSGGQLVSSGKLASVLDVIPVTAEFGAFVSHSGEGETDNHIYANELRNNLSVIDIQLRDEDNQLLQPNGHEVVIVLKIYT